MQLKLIRLTAKRFLIIYDSNLSYNKTKTVSVVLLSHIFTNLIAITINVLESHDSTIALRSNGNQASGKSHESWATLFGQLKIGQLLFGQLSLTSYFMQIRLDLEGLKI